MAAILLASLAVPAEPDGPDRSGGIATGFGRLQVDPDDVRAAGDEGEAAYSAAKTVLGLSGTRFAVMDMDLTSYRWGESLPDGTPVYVWQFDKGADGLWPPPVYILRHEIGHDLFIRYLVPDTKGGQYGGDAPDWLDEMAAVAFEGEALRATRRRSAALYAEEGRLIPLPRFLAMTHPEMNAGSIPAPSDRPATAFEPGSDETALFYATASAFHDFLIARTKTPAIVAELAAAFRKGERLDRWVAVRAGRGRGIEALDAEFMAWIKSDPKYGRALK